jgi:ComF family protein
VEPAFLNQRASALSRILALAFQGPCLGCGGRVGASELGGLCSACWKGLPWTREAIRGTWVAAPFVGAWRQAIHAYKFEGRLSFRRPFVALLAQAVDPESFDAVLGVPASKQALAERAYDPVEAFGRGLAKRCGLPYIEGALQRSRPGLQQSKLSRRQRLANARGAYQARPGMALKGKRLLLLDDVMTTGATLKACKQALLQAGAAQVQAMVLAAGI